MNDKLVVRVVYRNERQEPMYEKTYTLKDYMEMLRTDILRQITDVEDMAYQLNGDKPKEEWSDETWSLFCRIKHKLLDKAGDIGRLPENLCERSDGRADKDENSLSAFVAKVFNGNAVK